MVELTVVHDDFDPGGTVVDMLDEGWPNLLSDLKTLLETAVRDPGAHHVRH
jgi:hypothetical protein